MLIEEFLWRTEGAQRGWKCGIDVTSRLRAILSCRYFHIGVCWNLLKYWVFLYNLTAYEREQERIREHLEDVFSDESLESTSDDLKHHISAQSNE